MLKEVRCVLGLSFALFSSANFAATYLLTPGVSIDFDFPPNVRQVLKNPLFFPITATCTLKTTDRADDFYVQMLNNSARVNDVTLSKGQTMTLILHNADKLKISADAAAEVALTNLGQNTLKASCSTLANQEY